MKSAPDKSVDDSAALKVQAVVSQKGLSHELDLYVKCKLCLWFTDFTKQLRISFVYDLGLKFSLTKT